MGTGVVFGRVDPVQRTRVLIVAAITIATLAANLIGLSGGVTVVFPHLLYIPLILAGYWFPKRGILFSGVVSGIYGIAALVLIPIDSYEVIATVARCSILVIIGTAVSLLSIKLRESEQQLHDIIGFLPDATFGIDTKGRVIAWNRAIQDLTGKTEAEMLGKENYEYSLPFYHDRRPVLADLIVNPETPGRDAYPGLRHEGSTLIAEVSITHFHGGRGARLRVTAAPLTDAAGRTTGAIESIRDITDQVMTEAALQNASSRLNILAGIVRKDIAKKLSVLYGHLSIGVMKFGSPEFLAFIANIKESADGIQRQIEISREFRDLGTEPPAWIPVQPAVLSAAGQTEFPAVSIRAWTERLEVFADPHIQAVFFHRFENIKRTPGVKNVVVTYRIHASGCSIIIEDDGNGIPDSVKDSLFSRRREVYGCGLYLAHEILTITGMTVRETGIAGQGTRFEILIPSEGYRIR